MNNDTPINPDEPIPDDPNAGLIVWFQRGSGLPETNLFDAQTIQALKAAVDQKTVHRQ